MRRLNFAYFLAWLNFTPPDHNGMEYSMEYSMEYENQKNGIFQKNRSTILDSFFFWNMDKGTVFFFPRKRLGGTHSLDFRSGSEKKNKRVFFFSGPKFPIFCCFFFFPQEKFTLHSLTQNQRPEKKNSPGKKKKQHFYSLTRFSPKKYKF